MGSTMSGPRTKATAHIPSATANAMAENLGLILSKASWSVEVGVSIDLPCIECEEAGRRRALRL